MERWTTLNDKLEPYFVEKEKREKAAEIAADAAKQA